MKSIFSIVILLCEFCSYAIDRMYPNELIAECALDVSKIEQATRDLKDPMQQAQFAADVITAIIKYPGNENKSSKIKLAATSLVLGADEDKIDDLKTRIINNIEDLDLATEVWNIISQIKKNPRIGVEIPSPNGMQLKEVLQSEMQTSTNRFTHLSMPEIPGTTDQQSDSGILRVPARENLKKSRKSSEPDPYWLQNTRSF